MNPESKSSDAAMRGMLAALLDGEAPPGEADAACAAWHEDAEARGCWHAYALIGDVLRSDDLSRDAGRDAAFVHALRGRLAAEPVPLAPGPLRRAWRKMAVPAVVAAGFAAVAGSAIVLREPAAPDPASLMAERGASRPMLAALEARERRVERYIDAHRQQSIRRASLSEVAGGGR